MPWNRELSFSGVLVFGTPEGSEFLGGLSFRYADTPRGSEFFRGLRSRLSEVWGFSVSRSLPLSLRNSSRVPLPPSGEEERVTNVAFRNTSFFFLNAEIIAHSYWRDPVFVKTTEIWSILLYISPLFHWPMRCFSFDILFHKKPPFLPFHFW